LEVTQETEQTYCPMAWRTTGLQFKLQHVPRKLHTAADALSCPSEADKGKDDNQQMTMIPEAAFIRLVGPDSDGSIEHTITIIQNHNHMLMTEWEETYPIE
jgi:hypothetical protein